MFTKPPKPGGCWCLFLFAIILLLRTRYLPTWTEEEMNWLFSTPTANGAVLDLTVMQQNYALLGGVPRLVLSISGGEHHLRTAIANTTLAEVDFRGLLSFLFAHAHCKL